MPDSPLLEIDSLTFRYRRATEPAIRDVTLSVAAGEVLLVAGPSGCGKSTLIRAINGLIPHAYSGELSGVVRLLGRSTTDLRLREIALSVGTLLQDPAKQIVGSTVEAELAFGPENLAWAPTEIRHRIADVVVEAVWEQLGLKREVFAAIDRHVVSRQDVRRHNQADRLDLPQPFRVDGNFRRVDSHR